MLINTDKNHDFKANSVGRKLLTYQFPNPIENEIDDFFSNGVVTSGIVVSSIFFTSDQLLRMEQLSVCTSPHFV